MQADFSYEPVYDGAGCQLGVTILADRDAVRAQMRDDAVAAGFRVLECCRLDEFASGSIAALGDLVLVDCLAADAETMALLARLDMRAGKSGAQMVISTGMEALDAVFGCFSMSGAQILVEPGRAERIIAVGRVLADVPNLRLRELAEEDRLMLLRLTEQVGKMAERIERLSPGQREGGGAFRLEAAAQAWRGQDAESVRAEVPSLPDAAAIRAVIRRRQMRAKFFDADLFADPAWDILLDLAAARAGRERVSVTSLCIAAGVPATTALRWIAQMVESGLLLRIPDPADRRRAHIALADSTADAMARYFREAGIGARQRVEAVA
ncbi:helix-turn-helix domain-containing protein [Qipengyuania seohaensis]|uniref:MarR family transcriptional regulator n=1 Tax=Qipengyuania seohaensis TaxID=266951 RepID=UPI000C229A6F|nr:MarR family transcriptional regulator [Qipengyuania seohaensis]